MKKIKLFLAAMAAMVGMGAQAQLTDGNVYWLQDAATGQFLSQGDDWSTKAVAKDVGGLGFETKIVSENVFTLKNIMWNTVNNNANVGLGPDQYVDQSPANYTITASGDGYLISIDGNYLVNNGTENAYKEKPIGKTDNASAATVWKFLTKSEYDAAIQAYKDSKAASYATALGYTANTVAALEALINDEDQFMSTDYTSKIKNPTLSSNGNDWTHGKISQRDEGWAVGSGCAEFWNGCGYAKQTVSDLPNGLYKVTFVGTYRPKGSAESNNLTSDKTSSPAFVYANDAKIEFLHWIDVPNKANGRSGITTANGYGHSFYTYVTDGTLALGVVGDGWTYGGNWNPFGQFTLTYYSDQVSDADITALIATIPAEGTIPAAVSTNLASLKSTLESAKTIVAFNALRNAITEANSFAAPFAAYKVAAEDASIAGVAEATITEQNTAVNEATTIAEVEACTAALRAAIAPIASFDITSFTITNPSPYANGDGWTATNGNRLNQWASDPVTYDEVNQCAEMWSNTGASMLYTITNLPAGRYRLTAIAGTRANSGSVLKVGEKTIDLVSVGSVNSRAEAGTWFTNGNGVNELYFTLDAPATELTIGLVAGTEGDAWTLWRSFKLETFDESVLDSYLANYDLLVQDAQSTLDDEAYVNVTGDERTALEAAIDATPSTVAEYEAAVEALNTAVTAFTSAKTNYDIYAKERALADAISTDIVVAAPTTAENALVQFRALKVAEYNYVATAYPYSATSKIGEFTSWVRTGTLNGNANVTFETLTSQHWSGEERTYYEQPKNGWSANANTTWTANYQKVTTLPAGSYVIKVAARAASSTSTQAKITCSAATLDGPIFNFGDSGKGITKSGVASFDEGEFCNDGNGRGWVWNYLPFTLTEETTVTMTVVAEAKGAYQWFSVCDGELLSMNDIATAVAYDEATANTIEDVDVANVTMTRNIKADFNTVVLPFDLTANQVQTVFGSGTEVYAFSETSTDPNDVTINFNKVIAGTITANVPVLVKATQASTEQVFTGVQVVAPTTEEVKVEGTNFDFVGTYAPMTVAEGDYFIGNGALYKSAGNTSLKAFRAYIKAKTEASVKMFINGEEFETSISEINGVAENGVIYNLAGQRISKMQKGINIVNGKKVLF